MSNHSKTFFFFAIINLVLALYVIFLIPETRKVALEEMDVLFGGPNHVEKGGAQMGIEDVHHAHGENPGEKHFDGQNVNEVEQVSDSGRKV